MINYKDVEGCKSFLGISQELIKDTAIKICTDSRLLSKEDTFLAISGEKYNPLSFLSDIQKSGCCIVIYTENEKNNELVESFSSDLTFIKVKDSVMFLQEITMILSLKFQEKGGILVAISGSNGKTTTKEMLFHLFKSVHPETICTQKNNNNHIGVPLTLLQITPKTQYAIIELGSNHPGEIKVLCDIVKPSIGYTTNIGDTHMEFFQTQENVFKEEGYLYNAVMHSTSLEKYFFVNADDNFLKTYDGLGQVISIGQNGKDFKFIIDKDKVIVENKGYEFNITNNNIVGKHNFFNLCAAFSITKILDPDNTEKYLESAKSFRPTANRSQWLKYKNNEIFLDAYNANPSSMILAVEGFVEKVGKDANYCLILGDMNELGENAEKYHQETAEKIFKLGCKNLIFVGRFSNSYNAGCLIEQKSFKNTNELKESFENLVLNNYKYVFIKGSRSLQLESLLDIK